MKNKSFKMRNINFLFYVHVLVSSKLSRFPGGYIRNAASAFLMLALSVCSLFSASSPDLTGQFPEFLAVQLERQAIGMSSVYLTYSEKQTGKDVPMFYGGPTTYMACFDSNCFNIRTVTIYRDGRMPIHESTYDGTIFYYGDPDQPDKARAVLKTYLPGDKTDPEQSSRLYFECLEYAGFYMPQEIATVNQFHSIESLVMHYVKECDALTIETNGDDIVITVQVPDPIITAANQVNVDDLKKNTINLGLKPDSNEIASIQIMQKLTPLRKVVFTLSARLNYALVQRDDFTIGGEKIMHVQNDEWKFYGEEGIWLPSQSTVTYYTDRYDMSKFSDEPCLIVTCELQKVLFGHQTNVAFNLDYKTVGSIIVDRSSSNAVARPEHKITYVVAANGKLLLDTATAIRSATAPSRIMIIIMIVFLLIPPVVLIFKKVQK